MVTASQFAATRFQHHVAPGGTAGDYFGHETAGEAAGAVRATWAAGEAGLSALSDGGRGGGRGGLEAAFYPLWAGAIVFLMQAGFATLSAGSIRQKNVKNMGRVGATSSRHLRPMRAAAARRAAARRHENAPWLSPTLRAPSHKPLVGPQAQELLDACCNALSWYFIGYACHPETTGYRQRLHRPHRLGVRAGEHR